MRSSWWRTVLRWPRTVAVAALVGLVTVYKRFVSPLLGPRCRFYPSCSTYAIDSLRRHGPLKGTVLAGWRLLRCNPWNLGGLDPVPDRHSWRPDILPDGKPRVREAQPHTTSTTHSCGAHR